MNFTSPVFFCFFPIILAGYYVLPKKRIWIWLLSASILFYLFHSPWTALLLFFAIGSSYAGAVKIEETKSAACKKGWLGAVIFVCVGMLLFFKYRKFQPAGISFYTFQTLSYVIDVYRGKMKAERHFGTYALYISFFPQLVAGPIERPGNLLPQLKSLRQPDREEILYGLVRMLRGFFKKLAVADFLAVFADRVFAAPGLVNGPAAAAGTILFALQIYCDFSGYSDIARGCAQMFGVRLMENFDRPYLASSPREFWRRWQISLTSWLTDYIYKPLGGNKKGLAVQCRNILIVFLCSGLWHGGGLHFILWGLCHGVLVVGETILKSRGGFPKRVEETDNGWKRKLWQAVFFLLICFPWIFFRAENVQTAFLMIGKLGTGWNPKGIVSAVRFLEIHLPDLLQLVLGLGCVRLLNEKEERIFRKNSVLGVYFLIMAVFVAMLLGWSMGTDSSFIYFQF